MLCHFSATWNSHVLYAHFARCILRTWEAAALVKGKKVRHLIFTTTIVNFRKLITRCLGHRKVLHVISRIILHALFLNLQRSWAYFSNRTKWNYGPLPRLNTMHNSRLNFFLRSGRDVIDKRFGIRRNGTRLYRVTHGFATLSFNGRFLNLKSTLPRRETLRRWSIEDKEKMNLAIGVHHFAAEKWLEWQGKIAGLYSHVNFLCSSIEFRSLRVTLSPEVNWATNLSFRISRRTPYMCIRVETRVCNYAETIGWRASNRSY